MKLGDLRRLIREEVETALDEAESSQTGVPTNFNDFRSQVAAGLKQAGAPQSLVDELEDLDDEGGGATRALYSAWNNIEYELRDAGKDPAARAEAWAASIEFYVHDAIIDMAGEFADPMNYAPGAKQGQKPFDPVATAKAVVKAMMPADAKIDPSRGSRDDRF